jgi:hypothetical protein
METADRDFKEPCAAPGLQVPVIDEAGVKMALLS